MIKVLDPATPPNGRITHGTSAGDAQRCADALRSRRGGEVVLGRLLNSLSSRRH